MRERKSIFQNVDWGIILLYLCLVLMGWINIYAAVYNEEHQSIFDLSQNYGKQLMWIGTSVVLGIAILILDANFFSAFSFPIYIATMGLLVGVLLFGKEIAGSKSWFQMGSFALQPAEFAKFATSLALAKYLSGIHVDMKKLKTRIVAAIILGIPMLLILAQNDTGSALVYVAFVLVLYREGLSGNVLLLGLLVALLFVLTLLLGNYVVMGIVTALAFLFYFPLKKTKQYIIRLVALYVVTMGFVFSVDYAFEQVLEPHQKTRINVLLGLESDPHGAGYNVNQSKIAIGSGGFSGKGFLQGTQTKFDFVPEQSTDFIFCTVGEEWGFLGALIVIALFVILLLRILKNAERQRSKFSRIFGYGVASILFFHFAINLSMTMGLAPVIGIPLPFFSYGGSSLWGFTILLFIFVKLDSQRLDVL